MEDQQGEQPVQAAVPDAQGFLQNLNELIRAAVAEARAAPAPHVNRAVKLKVPTFDGKGDVELFIERLQEIALAQEWDEPTLILKAREGLMGAAQACGRAETWLGMVDLLRLHYGLTATEAEAMLASYKRTHGVSLAEYSTEIRRLVNMAYADADEAVRDRLTMERFRLGLNNAGLQGHLLARQPGNMEDMVRAGNEYLLITKNSASTSPARVREVEDQEDVRAATSSVSELQVISKAIEALTTEVTKLKQKLANSEARSTAHQKGTREDRPNHRQPSVCWGCHQSGHIRKDCPTRPWQAGNAEGLQQ